MTGPAAALTPELGSLMEHEKVIEQGFASMLDMAYAFEEIRDRRLYRARGFTTFEAYCQEQWGLTRRHVNRVVAGAAIAKELGPRGPIAPENEKQVRPLHALPDPDDRAAAWNDAVNHADGHQPTAKQVEQAVAKRRAPTQKDHPAPYSNAVLDKIIDHLATENLPKRAIVVDPFAGTGRIHEITGRIAVKTRGIEIQPKWAALHPDTVEGSALELSSLVKPGSVDAVATSMTFGNRMADTYTDGTVRQTYTACHGDDLHPENSGAMQWGPEYRDFHEVAWAEIDAVLKPGAPVSFNMKNHVRDGVEQRVVEWHLGVVIGLGYTIEAIDVIPTRGLMAGENHDVRTCAEFQIKIRKPEVQA